jgi:hypothetical protein
MLNACDSTEMCEVASGSGSQSMALAEVGCCACGSSHCFSLTTTSPQRFRVGVWP